MSEEQNTPAEESTEEAKAKANRILSEIKEQREKLVNSLKEWGIDLEKFASRASEAGTEAQEQFKKTINDVQTRVEDQRVEATAETKVIGDQIEIAWAKMKEGFEAIVARQREEAEAIRKQKAASEEAASGESESDGAEA